MDPQVDDLFQELGHPEEAETGLGGPVGCPCHMTEENSQGDSWGWK